MHKAKLQTTQRGQCEEDAAVIHSIIRSSGMAAAVEASHQPQRHHPDLPDMTPTKLGLEWPLLPEDAPAILRQDTIHVTEPYYVLTLRKKARKEQFVSLINR